MFALVMERFETKLSRMPRFPDLLAGALAAAQPFALGIISRTRGSSPQKCGAKALFLADGRIIGTLGGGCLEAEIQDRARRAMRTGVPSRFDLVLDHDFGWDDGLICGGSVSGLILPGAVDARAVWQQILTAQERIAWGVRNDYTITLAPDSASDAWLYREVVLPPFALWIAGSGHVAQAVAPIALQLDFKVTVFDDRPSLANHQHFPPATEFRVGDWNAMLTENPGPGTFGLVVTRGHQHDALVLRHWIHKPFAFLAMIGSRRKWRIISEQFVADGFATPSNLEAVSCPAGIDIEAVSPAEIAVSITAQLVQKRAEHLAGLAAACPESGLFEATLSDGTTAATA
jgi:xanthine dehydrogenase accessory factor